MQSEWVVIPGARLLCRRFSKCFNPSSVGECLSVGARGVLERRVPRPPRGREPDGPGRSYSGPVFSRPPGLGARAPWRTSAGGRVGAAREVWRGQAAPSARHEPRDPKAPGPRGRGSPGLTGAGTAANPPGHPGDEALRPAGPGRPYSGPGLSRPPGLGAGAPWPTSAGARVGAAREVWRGQAAPSARHAPREPRAPGPRRRGSPVRTGAGSVANAPRHPGDEALRHEFWTRRNPPEDDRGGSGTQPGRTRALASATRASLPRSGCHKACGWLPERCRRVSGGVWKWENGKVPTWDQVKPPECDRGCSGTHSGRTRALSSATRASLPRSGCHKACRWYPERCRRVIGGGELTYPPELRGSPRELSLCPGTVHTCRAELHGQRRRVDEWKKKKKKKKKNVFFLHGSPRELSLCPGTVHTYRAELHGQRRRVDEWEKKIKIFFPPLKPSRALPLPRDGAHMPGRAPWPAPPCG
ncbi:hypothetical protein Q7C36_014600 [Tachysurus vachellii]|uniref:Uncharacterized protein n=1 Tax=Tachysurus vachellii TaxID=175792 RepID=A0AA88MEX0_TACVA|nr:hypothetical protein Q7C36_014600 [Tachysurus vachellii]